MLLSHTAWHIALISSCTDASGPRQTHTQPERNTAELNKTFKVYYMALKHTAVLWRKMEEYIPFLTPKR